MKFGSAITIFLLFLLSSAVHAQTKAVLKGISTNALTENIVIPTGKTITIDSGGILLNNGATSLDAASVAGNSGVIFRGISSNTATLKCYPTSGSFNLTLPSTQGSANTFLKNDGSGGLSWAAASGVTAEVEVSTYATGGSGTSGSPWTGWDTAITWTEFTRYRFKSGYYEFSTSPNYLKAGIELIGEPGVYLRHAQATSAVGPAFKMDAGATAGGTWIQNVRVQNINIIGKPEVLTGTSVSLSNGGTTLTGVGTSFTTQLPVGASVTFGGGTSSARSYIITAVASNTSATIDRNATQAESAVAASSVYACRTTYGFYLRGVRNGVFEQLSSHDIGTAGIWTEGCVTNSLRMFRCTIHEPTQSTHFLCRPKYGIVTYTRGAAYPSITDWTTTLHIEEPVIEGTQSIGIWFTASSYGNTILNGTSESNKGIGVQVDGDNHTIINLDIEANGSTDLYVRGNENIIKGCVCGGDGVLEYDGAAQLYCAKNTFEMNAFQNFTIGSSCLTNVWISGRVNATYTDNGNGTFYFGNADDFRSFVGVPVPRVKDYTNSFTHSLGDGGVARCTVTDNVTVGVPTKASNGAELLIIFNNFEAAAKTITWATGAGGFQSSYGCDLPTTVYPSTYSPDVHESLYVTLRYDSSVWNRWICVNVAGGPKARTLKLMEPSGSGTNFTAFTTQAQSGDVTYTLPAADGSSGQMLSTNGSGTLSWASASSGVTIGTTAITSGTSGRVLYDSAGVVGEMTTSGSGTVLALATSPSFTTPTLGAATATTINGLTLTSSTGTLTVQNGVTLNSGATSGTVAILGANTFTGVQTLPNGAVGAPAINFGDATSGIYRSASNELSVALAGTQRFQFKSDTFYSDVLKPMSGSSQYFDATNSLFRGSGGIWVQTYLKCDTPQDLSGAGAVNVTKLTTYYTSTGAAQALTLADGVDGQIKTIMHVVDGGSGVLTPTTKTGFSTITFTNAGDSVILQFKGTQGWMVLGSYGVTIAP